MPDPARIRLFATRPARRLGEDIAARLGVALSEMITTEFSDGELSVRFPESIRGETIFLLAQANMPYENLWELFLAVDAAQRASAREVIGIIPYLPHSRQERKDSTRASIAARLLADFLQDAGLDRLITCDLHTTAIEGFYKRPVDHLEARPLFLEDIRERFDTTQLCLCSPDFGGLKRIRGYKKELGCAMAAMHKERLAPNQVAHMEIIGDPESHDVVIIDDMVDTAGTLCRAADLLMEQGARSVTAYCTHGLLSGEALAKIEASSLAQLIITDTIPRPQDSGKIRVISSAPMLAEAIARLSANRSIKAMGDAEGLPAKLR